MLLPRVGRSVLIRNALPRHRRARVRCAQHNVPGLDTGGALRYDPAVAAGAPCVLHFINCGFEWCVRRAARSQAGLFAR